MLVNLESNWFVPDDTDAESPGEPEAVPSCTDCALPCAACWLDAAGRCSRCSKRASRAHGSTRPAA